ncbi:MAG: glycosyltransferase family 1 protein [Planctomycetes bacterium]|nr:glycosyltransferase family 1 protein [Planctomycetota bacterium]
MYSIKEFKVVPAIPEPLEGLKRLAYNLWWTWNHDAIQLFQRLDRQLWEDVQHNAAMMLAAVPQHRLERAAKDNSFLANLARVLDSFSEYQTANTWFSETFPEHASRKLAYFSMEFGLHESLPVYSGGLGCLAGDHMKSASDLGVPLIGVGLLYHQGYFQQFLSKDGWQFEDYPELEVHHLPIELVKDDSGKPLMVSFPVGEREVHAQIYRVNVGRARVFMLDTVLPENDPDDRAITSRLYGGDQQMRIRQEIVLGFGGVRALRALGFEPSVFHMNEGHSAFLALERIGHLVETAGLSFAQAREAVAGSTIFTTHTPVPAGIDTFPRELVTKYLQPFSDRLGVTMDEIVGLGQTQAQPNSQQPFSMATLALHLSRNSNGVSKVHGRVAREMWQGNWPNVPVPEVPITSVTNGVHVRSWLAPDFERLFERYLGPSWSAAPDDGDVWTHVNEIPDSELWLAHERRREQLVVAARAHLRKQALKRGDSPALVAETEELLNPEALTIGFARRFAPYKRATLLLTDEERLIRILSSTDRPVQFVFAGKAHPRDNLGKELIKRIVQFARDENLQSRFVFIENYNMSIARFLVQGVDVWMNTPTKPLEASGTSGMKVVPNGGINFSVLDGWWSEAYDGDNGWIIGDDRIYDSAEYQDQVESEAIYETLEREIIPEFYDRSTDGLPRKWIARMKASMRSCTAQFSAARMVRQYVNQLYMPAMKNGLHLTEQNYQAAKELAEWKNRIETQWKSVHIESFAADDEGEHTVGAKVKVRALVRLGDVNPKEVAVQLYHGPKPTNGVIEDGNVVAMQFDSKNGDGLSHFTGNLPCDKSGEHAFAVRILPKMPDVSDQFNLNLIQWA